MHYASQPESVDTFQSQLRITETAALTIAAGERAGTELTSLPADREPAGRHLLRQRSARARVLQAMTALRVQVPDDVAIIGYDDIHFAAAAAVPLSSVRQPRHQLGRTAAQLLLDEALGEVAHQHRQAVFEPELVFRRSSTSRDDSGCQIGRRGSAAAHTPGAGGQAIACHAAGRPTQGPPDEATASQSG